MSKQIIIMPCPPGTKGVYSIGAVTEPLAFTLAGLDSLFLFQWTNLTHYAILDYLDISVGVSGTITTAVVFGLELTVLRDFADTPTMQRGRVLTPTFASTTANNQKLKTDFEPSKVKDLRIAASTPLDVGSYTPDAFSIGQVVFGTGTAVGTTALAKTILHDRATNFYPLVLNTNEGFMVNVPDGITGPVSAAGIANLRISINARWLEITKQVF